ncbi:MAG TPA: biotin carboxylase N-terminal domain-containing protein, partial [Thermomicrobiales bacterium]|nr:biotin carboxylase N-terminal domain-containing protein [Thermomicrobiales bacterium]
MNQRVLIANRGEIAIRIIRACRDLGWETIAVYDQGEENALHVQLADDAYALTSAQPIPYLDQAALMTIATRSGATCVHPGYGFLAENAAFAELVTDAGITYVGPPASAIRTMGDKVAARAAAVAAGVPILPGTIEPVADLAAVRNWADEHGYPVALKAAAGGGGRGFRVARGESELADAFASAQSESSRAFGDDRLYVERYLERPRHVEIQVFADAQGMVVALGDRDCSIQRRHQKLLEEAPAPGLSEDLRNRMAEVSIRLTRAVGYFSAGTLEFLVEPDETFWFLEMNTRIQVEHTVTEEIFGIDLVREQLLVAIGQPMSFAPSIQPRGHAIQFRINAEDPGRSFAPAPGPIHRFVPPLGTGIRVDTAVTSGSVISDRYDSMIAKLVVTGRNRDEVIARGQRALAEMQIEGVPTTQALHQNILASDRFQSANLSVGFLADEPGVVPAPALQSALEPDAPEPWSEQVVEVNGKRFSVRRPASHSLPTSTSSSPRPKRNRSRHSNTLSNTSG